jgi:predicted HicB family RNase H-like nuclease
MRMTGTTENRVLRLATRFFERKNADWVTFYRQVLGPAGIVRRLYPSANSRTAFEQTETYRQVQQMLTDLRKRPPIKDEKEREKLKARQEPTRIITVRIPQSLHEVLLDEAYEYRTSVNKLCISKLMQFIDSEMVPGRFRVAVKTEAAEGEEEGEESPETAEG